MNFIQLATETFATPGSSLGPNWSGNNFTLVSGTVDLITVISGNLAEPTNVGSGGTHRSIQCYTAQSFQSNQYSEVTIATIAGSADYCIPIVRAQPGHESFYFPVVGGPSGASTTFGIWVRVDGNQNQIGSSVTATWHIGDVARFTVIDSPGGPLLTILQNGIALLQVQDTTNQFPRGYPGLFLYADTDVTHAQASLWAGGIITQPQFSHPVSNFGFKGMRGFGNVYG